LIPFIESKYRAAKNDRTLMGSSYGGLFTLYAMFHETALFQRYVLTSPALALHAETETDFYLKGQRLLIHFKKDSSGKVTGFQLERYGGEEFVRKVN
jgi:predicted alpha/beta superfamily hydrolase